MKEKKIKKACPNLGSFYNISNVWCTAVGRRKKYAPSTNLELGGGKLALGAE